MATRPIVDKNTEPALPVADRLLLAEELLDLAERAQAHTRATGCAIALKLGDKLFVRTSIGLAPEVGASLPIGEGAIGECARAGRPCNLAENQIDATLRSLGVRSVIAIPIHHAGIFYGVLVTLSQAPEAFTRMHVAIMMTMANEVARVLKRMEPIAVEIAPGAPLQNTIAPAAAAKDSVVEISLSPSAKEEIVETLKTIEQQAPPAPIKTIEKQAAPAPMRLIIDPPRAAKPTPVAPVQGAPTPQPVIPVLTVAGKAVAPVAPAASTTASGKMAAAPSLEIESTETGPAPELLCPGEDPREYGTLKSAKSLEPKPTYTAAAAFRPTGGSRMKIPAMAAAALLIGAVGFGVWHYSKAPAQHQNTAAAEPAAAPAAAPTTSNAPISEAARSTAPAASVTVVTTKPAAEKKPADVKVEETKAAVAEQPKHQEEQPALRIIAAKHTESAPAEAPSLALATPAAMPDLGTPKVPAASLAVKRSTATPPAVLHQVAQVYPEIARRAGTSGDVRMQVTVSPSGKVSNVRVIDGYPVLRQAASSAVSQWVYRPATLDGRPVESTVDVVVKFAPR